MRQEIEVMYSVNGTTVEDIYTADRSSITISRQQGNNVALLRFWEGVDAKGPVMYVHYTGVYRIIKRPFNGNTEEKGA